METKKINFEENYNHKMLCLTFLSVMPQIPEYYPGDKVQLRINDNHFCFAKICDKREVSFKDIFDQNVNLIDMNLAPESYYDFMIGKYNKRKWWKNMETKFDLIWFQKITQLDMFENNEILKIE